jgi:hypothetical protein
MTPQSVSSQSLLPQIQNTRGISYVGAWTKYGFHEDGFASAMKLVGDAPFNAKPPFPFQPATREIKPPSLGEMIARIIVLVMERVRRRGGMVYQWTSWVVVLFLFWVGQIFGAVRWEGGVREAARLRECWIGAVKRV